LAGWPWKKIGSLALIYTPMDGMNEKGLAMCILELPHHPAGNDTVKADIATSTLIRLVLDRCATVDEAVALVETLDMFDDPFDTSSKDVVGSAYHYQISDARGKSVVIEYDYENCFTVIPVYKAVDAEWQICTNHYLTEKYSDEGDAISDSWGRYAKVDKELSQGSVTEKGCMDILSDVSVENIYYPEYGDYYSSTQWSVVYNLTDLTASVCMG
jgi:predicted choloylglycine hydrolase